MHRKEMQKGLLGIAAICVCIFAFLFAVSTTPVSAVRSSIVITGVTPTELHQGDTRDVILTVKNSGAGDARDVRLEFQVEDKKNVSLVGRTEVQIPALNSMREKKEKITVHVEEGIPNGVYVIPVKFSWYEYYFDTDLGYYVSMPNNFFYHPDAGGFWGSPVTSDIAFVVKGSPVITLGDVYTEPAHVRQGYKNVKLTMKIGNTGEATAKDVEAKLICDDTIIPSRSGADRVYIGEIEAGKAISTMVFVDIAEDAATGVYNLPLVIAYKDRGNSEYELNKTIRVLVEGKPKLEMVSYYTEPRTINAGDHVALHVGVRNVGTEEAESVSVRVAGSPFNFSTGSDKVGTLRVNKTGNAILEFDVAANTVDDVYPQGLELICVGDDGANYTFKEQIQSVVHQSNSTKNNISATPEAPSSTPGFDALLSFIAFILSAALLFVAREK